MRLAWRAFTSSLHTHCQLRNFHQKASILAQQRKVSAVLVGSKQESFWKLNWPFWKVFIVFFSTFLATFPSLKSGLLKNFELNIAGKQKVKKSRVRRTYEFVGGFSVENCLKVIFKIILTFYSYYKKTYSFYINNKSFSNILTS